MKAQDLDYQPKPDVIEDPPPPMSGFDFRTHIKDARTGELIRIQAYRRRCIGNQTFCERPVDSGNLWYEDGKQAGRWVKGPDGKFFADESAEHIQFIAPKTQLRRQTEIEDENEILRLELAARDEELAALRNGKSAKVEEKPRK